MVTIFFRAVTFDGDKSYYSDESHSRRRFSRRRQQNVTKEVGGAWARGTQEEADKDDIRFKALERVLTCMYRGMQ